ncbi:MAG TPA: hypothetical protein VHY57_09785 [Rhizomicrobium sp.]|nr:hypothetical protein [Rhizomicrobium sp.]HSS13976.1 hypothetical protein [Rhizomicrobium sp.]
MRKCVPFILLACLAMAGCWQSRARPYRDAIGVQPFAAGAITATDLDGKVAHYTLRKIERGRYRLTPNDRGRDFGQGFELGLFPLPGAPSRVLILQMAMLSFHTGDDNLRYYALLVVTGKDSAGEIVPRCGKDARAARVSGVVKDGAGICTFPGRASLEKSLLALWKSGKKPETVLRLERAIGSPR